MKKDTILELGEKAVYLGEIKTLGYIKEGKYKPNLYYIRVPKVIIDSIEKLSEAVGKKDRIKVTLEVVE